ncbi:FliA/WhiG family RNA polymerase sigma factor [Leptolinea tardivitalis]|uniref:FliA/WhiG family RNA polymerase sigma factor n=1 Tax=Leptolinea tardivitalis TaxID=229920 RepID=UPI00078400D5|nr:FliA/WhiG family RNA polymerase sigma factor [Leptolinea tardivitalis]GAP22495.1 RNA polymerase, sigma 28 subunit, SigD/FliA/WhiG [Leptolinea tardivitalis]
MEDPKAEAEMIETFLTTRNPELREELIMRYVSLIHFVLGRLGFNPYGGVEYEDLASQGMLGLIEAVDHFDPAYGTRLSTYATLKIRSKVLDYLRDLDWLPRIARQKVRAMQNAMVDLEHKLHRLPTDEELAGYLNLNLEELSQIQVDSSRVIISLDETTNKMNSEDGESSMHEWLMDEQQENPSDMYEEKDMQAKLVEAIKALPEREQMVLSLYYFDELTFKEIGKTLDISESRVCQIHGRAVVSLQSLLNGEVNSKRRGRPSKQEQAKQKKNSELSQPPAHSMLDRYR